MMDRAYQALHLLALDPEAETTGDPNSYGFRKGRSTADAIGQRLQFWRVRMQPGSAGAFEQKVTVWLGATQ